MTAFVPSDEVARIRARLGHPVVDADGHLNEFLPWVFDLLTDIAGRAVTARLQRLGSGPEDRGLLASRVFFTLPSRNSLDRMTSVLPELLYQRLDELGIDFALLYPTYGLRVGTLLDDEIRQALAHSLNTYFAQAYDGYRDRLEPVAVIPTFTPQEAIAELEHAVVELGLKAVVMSGVTPRTIRPDGTKWPWVDTLGHESLYDYDPLWARCAELGVTPSFHGTGFGWGSRSSATNYVYSHLGHFAAAQEAVCRSLLIHGVPRRFPSLHFTFLEGGVAWAAQLYADALGHYDKRNRYVVRAYDPSALDVEQCRRLFEKFATAEIAKRWEPFERGLRDAASVVETDIDDFAESGIRSPDDIVDAFTRQFSFGCEADDPLSSLAFRTHLLPHGARLNALFASDISHWDVPDMRDVLPDAWEMVEHGHLTEEEFRAFTCDNVVRGLTATNPRFFDGTVVSGLDSSPGQ